MEAGLLDVRTGQIDRVKLGNGGDTTRVANLPTHVPKGRGLLLMRELVSDRTLGLAVQVTEVLTDLRVVELDNDAVNLVADALADAANVGTVDLVEFLEVLDETPLRNAEAHGRQGLQLQGLLRHADAVRHQVVGEDGEVGTLGGVGLPKHRAVRTVAGVGLALEVGGKVRVRDDDFATNRTVGGGRGAIG